MRITNGSRRGVFSLRLEERYERIMCGVAVKGNRTARSIVHDPIALWQMFEAWHARSPGLKVRQ